jgi:hypothetical protein
MKPPPLSAQLEDGQLREPHERLCAWLGWLLSKSVGTSAGIYVMVRGLDNIDKGLSPKWRGKWERIFYGKASPCRTGRVKGGAVNDDVGWGAEPHASPTATRSIGTSSNAPGFAMRRGARNRQET